MRWLIRRGCSVCYRRVPKGGTERQRAAADFNRAGAISVQGLFDDLAAYFKG